MSDVSSTSTLTEVQAAYDDNASYLEDASPTKAAAFVTAGTILLRRVAARSGHSQSSIEFDMRAIRDEVSQARTWLAANPVVSASADSGVTYFDNRGFRS